MKKPNLAYTLAFDPPGSGGQRQMAKMLASSMARTFFTGDFVIFRNSPDPIFLLQREGIREIFVDVPLFARPHELATYAMNWKPRAREFIDPADYHSVLFLDADCLVLRNLDHLLDRQDEWDVLFQRERGRRVQMHTFNGYLSEDEMRHLAADGINSGSFAVRSELFHSMMERWERLIASPPLRFTRWGEQSAWNRLILDAGPRARPFESHEIQFPLHIDPEWSKYRSAALLHLLGGNTGEKIEFMFGMYMQKFFHDNTGTIVGLLDM